MRPMVVSKTAVGPVGCGPMAGACAGCAEGAAGKAELDVVAGLFVAGAAVVGLAGGAVGACESCCAKAVPHSARLRAKIEVDRAKR